MPAGFLSFPARYGGEREPPERRAARRGEVCVGVCGARVVFGVPTRASRLELVVVGGLARAGLAR